MKKIEIQIHENDYAALEYYAGIRGVSVSEYVRMIAGIPPTDPAERKEYFKGLLEPKNYEVNAQLFCEDDEGRLNLHTLDSQVRRIEDGFIPLLEDMGILKKRYM